MARERGTILGPNAERTTRDRSTDLKDPRAKRGGRNGENDPTATTDQ